MSDSSFEETTYSEDERYELYKAEKSRQELLRKQREERRRKEHFIKLYNALQKVEDSIFYLPGLKFIHFDHVRIKFRIEPSKMCEDLLVSSTVKFYCSIYYIGGRWWLKRNSIPTYYKLIISNIFYAPKSPPVTDFDILDVVERIYNFVKHWAAEHHKYRALKYARWCSGEDVILDSDDDELFFTDVEIAERHAKRQEILQRMMSPRL